MNKIENKPQDAAKNIYLSCNDVGFRKLPPQINTHKNTEVYFIQYILYVCIYLMVPN